MPKVHLTAAFAATAAALPGKQKTDWYDTQTTGFVLEARASGGRTWYLRYEDSAGRQKQHKIGRFEDVSLAAARKAAQHLRSDVVMGGDPAARKAEARAVPLYAELAARHMADAELHHRSFATTEGYMRNHIVTRWGRVRLTEIEQPAVARWLASLRDNGLSDGTVAKVRAIFGRSFELGRRWGVPGAERNPVRGIPSRPVNNARTTYVDADGAARLVEAAGRSRNPALAAVVRLLLLTGARVSELLSARWEHVEVERRSWLVPTSKNGRSRHVPLSGAALEVIAGLPSRDTPFLFPNPARPDRHLTTVKHGFERARAAAGLPGLRIHDLRHSAASAMVSAGVELFTVGRILGHADHKSTMRYSHLADDALLAAVERGAARLQAAA